MKRSSFLVILLIITALIMASCSSTPKNQAEESPVEETADSIPPEAEAAPVEEVSEITEEADTEEIVPVEDNEPSLLAEIEPVLAPEPETASPPPPLSEPEPPPVVSAPPLPPAPEPPPPPPAPEPPPPPPPVVSVPTPPPPAPEPPRAPTPAPVAPAPPPPPPPIKEEIPIIPWEPPPPEIPDLPNPTPAITGIQEPEMAFSRTVRATVGQLVVIPFRGTGWVYLGEAGAQRGIVYDSRRLDPEGQNFVFRTEAPGEYALKFYRQDFIRDFILNDYVKVIVGPPPETAGTGWFGPSFDRGRVIAEPRWPTSLAEAEALRADTRPSRPDTPPSSETGDPSAQAQPPTTSPSPPTAPVNPAPLQPPATSVQPPSSPATPVQPVAPTSPPIAPVQPPATPTQPPTAPVNPAPLQPPVTPPQLVDPEPYLEKAKEEFGAGRVASAISVLDQLRAYYPIEGDETLWLYGQFYEANSPSRDILISLGYYRRLMDEYPQSSRYDDARRRVAYLQRYYINIH